MQEFQFEDLDEYYYSAPVKRMIWQAVQALKEITQIMDIIQNVSLLR